MKFARGNWVVLKASKEVGVVVETSCVTGKVSVSIFPGKGIREVREEEVTLLSYSDKERQQIEQGIKKIVEETN